MDKRLSIVVIEPDPERAAPIVDGLREIGDHDIRIFSEETGLARHIAECRPDIVLIDLANPSRDILEELALASGPTERPVAMFVDRSDATMMQTAVDAGISAYVVDGLRPERIKSILDVAILRFNAFSRLQRELAEARSELADRKVIERAKGILMKQKSIDEAEAYRLMRSAAMNGKMKLVDVARSVVTAAELLM